MLFLFKKRITIAFLNTRPVFRSAWHFATAGAIFSSSDSFFSYQLYSYFIISKNVNIFGMDSFFLYHSNILFLLLLFHPPGAGS
jgi:hypothetical protein